MEWFLNACFPIVRIVLQIGFSVFNLQQTVILGSSGGIPLLPLSSCSLVPRTFFFFFHFLLIGPDIFLFILTVLGMRLFSFCWKVSFSPFVWVTCFLLPFFFSPPEGKPLSICYWPECSSSVFSFTKYYNL